MLAWQCETITTKEISHIFVRFPCFNRRNENTGDGTMNKKPVGGGDVDHDERVGFGNLR
jgi:hypothetical protein